MKMFLLGMLTMSALTTIGIIIENETNVKVGFISLGPVMWLVFGLSRIWQKICRWLWNKKT